MSDTLLAARSDAFRAALKAYNIAQMLEQQVPGMETSLQPLRSIFDRPARNKKKENTK